MSVCVQLPPVLRHVMGGARSLEAEGTSIAAVLCALGREYPALALHFFDEHGAVRHNIVCVHNGAVVRACEMPAHEISDGDEVILANALAGG